MVAVLIPRAHVKNLPADIEENALGEGVAWPCHEWVRLVSAAKL